MDDLSTLPLDEIRSRRAALQGDEVGLSYLRRLVQGRLDIVDAAARNRGGSIASLVEELPSILGEHVHAPGTGRLPTLMAPSAEDETRLRAELDAIVAPEVLTALDRLDDDELAGLVERLNAFEREISERRRDVHHDIDALQAELTRRYKTGEADVESLLT
ncbi:MAG TPA: hypothetical protein VFK42_11895 [Acidimicrobiales bacterium]|jgi:hypothetical protein|nr:hypothetical protein [Acidimicrobiales bacterium]